MNPLPILIVSAILLLFVLVVYGMITSARKETAAKAQMAAMLGFSPCSPDPALLAQFLSLYPNRQLAHSEFKNVFRKVFPDGEIYLFDLTDTSGSESTRVENQAVAVLSPRLDLPPFMIYPLAGVQGWAAGLANRVMRFVAGKIGTPVEFPEVPEFQSRYLLSSWDPVSARQFFEPQMIRQLAQTSLLSIDGSGSLFILASFDPTMRKLDQQSLSNRVNQALEVFSILQQGRRQFS